MPCAMYWYFSMGKELRAHGHEERLSLRKCPDRWMEFQYRCPNGKLQRKTSCLDLVPKHRRCSTDSSENLRPEVPIRRSTFLFHLSPYRISQHQYRAVLFLPLVQEFVCAPGLQNSPEGTDCPVGLQALV